MKANGLGQFKTIDSFVKAKIADYQATEKTFRDLFYMMFRERENVMYEYSSGYRIVKKTYGQVQDEIMLRASTLRLQLASVPAGSTVGLYMENGLDWIELFWSILLCGFEPVLLNLRVSDELLRQTLTDGKVQAVVSDGRMFDVPTVLGKDVIPDEEPMDSIAPGSLIWVMSSGTSRNIKLCGYGAEEFFYQICGSYEIIRSCAAIKTHYEGNLKLLTFLPFYHVFGLIAVYVWFAFFSRTFVQLNDMAPSTILNTVKRHKVTHIFAVPLFWETVYEQTMKTVRSRGEATYAKLQKGLRLSEKLDGIPLLAKLFRRLAFREVRTGLFGESICFLITGGSYIKKRTLSFFNAIGYRLADGYGMTEIGITSVELTAKKKYLWDGFVGKPLAFAEYKLVDGELLVRGKATAKFIIEKGVRTENTDWYNTHDLAEEKDGHYRILARKDDVIVSPNGENINPYFLEGAFALPHVKGVALIKGQDGENVAPVLLVSVDKFIGREALTEVQKRTKAIAAEKNFPRDGRILWISDPLLTGNEFKLNRLRLAEDYAAHRLHVLSPETMTEAETIDDPLYQALAPLVAAALALPEVNPDADFFLDGNGTSLAYFGLLSQIQEEFGINLQEKNLRTLRQMYQAIKEDKNRVDSVL